MARYAACRSHDPPDSAGWVLFAMTRMAGFAAHYLQENSERPLRFRALARQLEG